MSTWGGLNASSYARLLKEASDSLSRARQIIADATDPHDHGTIQSALEQGSQSWLGLMSIFLFPAPASTLQEIFDLVNKLWLTSQHPPHGSDSDVVLAVHCSYAVSFALSHFYRNLPRDVGEVEELLLEIDLAFPKVETSIISHLPPRESPLPSIEPVTSTTMMSGEGPMRARVQGLIDQFAKGEPHLGAVPAAIVNRVEDFVGRLIQHHLVIVGTVTEDGVLAIETKLNPTKQLFVEIDRDGAVEVAIFEPETGARGLDVAAIGDLTPQLMENIIGSAE